MSPHWIALEGGDGSGKSTQAARLAEHLGALLTREPGGTAVGGRIRELLLDATVQGLTDRTEALLMAADRAQHVVEVVTPALESGRDVVSDRSAWSSLAYQGYGRGLDVEDVRRVCDWASGGAWPDLAVLLVLPPRLALARRRRDPDRLEAAGDEFHLRVDAGFAELAAAEPARWVTVEGEGSVDDVSARVIATVEWWIGKNA